MIEQHGNRLTISFPDETAATAFSQFLSAFFRPVPTTGPLAMGDPLQPAPEISVPPSEPSQVMHSRHTVLTPEREEALFNQRQAGQTASQRLLRAQTTLRDGVLPFSRPGEVPQSTGQPSPRIKAAAEGGFADGSGAEPEAERKRSRLRPVPSPDRT